MISRVLSFHLYGCYLYKSRGVLPLSIDGGALLRFEKLTLRGTHFLKKVNGTKIPKIFQNFLLFSQIFQKRYPMRDWIFYFSVFANPTWDSWRWKKVPWPAEHPRTPFCPSTPGIQVSMRQKVEIHYYILRPRTLQPNDCCVRFSLPRGHL